MVAVSDETLSRLPRKNGRPSQCSTRPRVAKYGETANWARGEGSRKFTCHRSPGTKRTLWDVILLCLQLQFAPSTPIQALLVKMNGHLNGIDKKGHRDPLSIYLPSRSTPRSGIPTVRTGADKTNIDGRIHRCVACPHLQEGTSMRVG